MASRRMGESLAEYQEDFAGGRSRLEVAFGFKTGGGMPPRGGGKA